MPQTTPESRPELRRGQVAPVADGRSPESLAEEREPSARAIRNRVRQRGGAEAFGGTV